MSHHHTYYVTSSCSWQLLQEQRDSIRDEMPQDHEESVFQVTSSYMLCHIIIHAMSHHHTCYVTSSYMLCHIIIRGEMPQDHEESVFQVEG